MQSVGTPSRILPAAGSRRPSQPAGGGGLRWPAAPRRAAAGPSGGTLGGGNILNETVYPNNKTGMLRYFATTFVYE